MNPPLISIITPTYHRPHLLDKVIKNIQSQTVQDYEHIIVSDHCEFAPLVYDKHKCDDRIRFFELDGKKLNQFGVAHQGRNLGLQKAEGNVICYLDDDNLYKENGLELFLRDIEDCDVVHCRYEVHRSNATACPDFSKYNLGPKVGVKPEDPFDGPTRDKQWDTCACAHRKWITDEVTKWIDSVKLYNHRGEDGTFFRKINECIESHSINVKYSSAIVAIYNQYPYKGHNEKYLNFCKNLVEQGKDITQWYNYNGRLSPRDLRELRKEQ